MITVNILQNEYIFENTVQVAEAIIQKVNQVINDESTLIFSHMSINGQEVYANYLEHIQDNIEEIEVIEVHLKPLKRMIHDSLLSTEEYISANLAAIENLANEFYTEVKPETWTKFDDLLGALQMFDQLLIAIEENKDLSVEWGKFITFSQELQGVSHSLVEAVENKDTVLLADVIKYEVVDYLKRLNEEIQDTIDREVVRNDIN